jgi:pimeloyl-ACP methyl ester carboxylesterase
LNHQVLKSTVAGLCLLFATLGWGAVSDYGYPLKDKYVATVVGTPHEYRADLPDKIPFKGKSITIFPDRVVPDALFYDAELRYSTALQKKSSPLIFLIAGTGAAHNGSKNKEMARAFYQAGFHVVSISSPTYTNFAVAASKTGVPGHPVHDAEDIYRVMEKINTELKGDIDVTEFHVAGYSLGAFNAAFVSKLDEDRNSFDFKRVLLINPPVSLYNSISLLDRMVENIPGGADNFDLFFEDLVRAFTEVYKEGSDDIGDDFLYAAFQAMDLKDEQLAALVGVSFRLSSGSLVFVADVMTDYGYVKPKELKLDRYSNLQTYRQVVSRLGFTDYYHEFFYPYYRDNDNAGERDAFMNMASLASIEDYLRNSPKISVMHNEDDIILEPGEINFFRDVFGDRAKIYPYGGHCGNMSYRDNVAHMINTFTR